MEKMYGIGYTKPNVILLQQTGIGTSELAARTCYDSFDASENLEIKELLKYSPNSQILPSDLDNINAIKHSDLLDTLAWTHFHHSILEHANLTYLIKGTSRGVLQEHARHRIQAISVRSTRYTMSSILNAFVASLRVADESNALRTEYSREYFIQSITAMDLFVTSDPVYNIIEIDGMYNKLHYQLSVLGYEEFLNVAIPKSSHQLVASAHTFKVDAEDLFEALEKGKKKRNVGDAFKHLVTDNVKVDMVVTFNVRSLKNYFTLRDSGAAYFQIRWLAQAMKAATPKKYLDLIIKDSACHSE